MPQTCSVEGCDRPAAGRGWCRTHYMRWYNTGVEPSGPIASLRKQPEVCAVDGCELHARIEQWCAPHGKRAARSGGDPGPSIIRKQAGNNRGKGRWVGKEGYVWLRRPEHPNAYSNGCLQEHTFVMSEVLGRPLIKGENVHHKNGRKTDNRPQNLELWLTSQPKGQRVNDLVAWAREVIDRYGDIPPENLG